MNIYRTVIDVSDHQYLMTQKCFLYYWLSLRSLVDSPHDRPVKQRFDVFYVANLNKWIVLLPVIWDKVMLMEGHCNVEFTGVWLHSASPLYH